MQPFLTEPSPSFDRTLSLKVKFGWVASDLAAEALARPTVAFPMDAGKEQRYRDFLRSQTGESRAHYEGFSRRVKAFNEENEGFMKKAKEGR